MKATALFALLCAATLHAAPTVSVIAPAPGSAISTLTSVSVTFSEPVSGVAASDLGVNGEPIVSVTGTGAGPYVFSFPQPPPGSVSLGWDADHSIAGLGTGEFVTPAGWNYTLVDNVAPDLGKIPTSVAGQELDSVFPMPGSTAGVLAGAAVTFSEPVTGVDASDLLVNGVPATAVTGDTAGPYSFTFTQPAAGSVNFSWAAGHGIADSAGNGFAGTGWSATLTASAGTVVITEFLARNGGTAVMAGSDTDGTRDENWDLSSWIELHNTGAATVNLLGWSLTDDLTNPRQWVFPARNLAAGARVIVFASGKDRKPATGNLHTNFGLGGEGGSLALFSPDTPADTPASGWPNYPPQRYDYSYGAQSTDGQPRYFSPPTVSQGSYTLPSSDLGGTAGTVPPVPAGVLNGTSLLIGVTSEPHASVARGFFNEPFDVVLSCPDASAVVRFTLDGSPPLASSTAYTAPLNIAGTTVLRMAAFGADKVPSRTVTHTWLFPDHVVTSQPSPPYDNPARTTDDTNPQPPAPGGSPLPIAWGISSTFNTAQTFPGFPTGTATGANNLNAGQIPADYGMDPKVWADPTKYNDTGAVDAANGRTNIDRIKNALRTQPALSLVIRSTDMFGTYPNGQATAAASGNPAAPLYPNSHSSVKTDMTKPCSLELLQPDGTTVFVVDCGIDLHGNASRDPFKNPKHGFTIRFRGKYGAGKVEGNIFPDSPVREWDKLILRGDFGGSWLHQNGTDLLSAGSDSHQRPRGIRIREAFCKNSFRDMGRIGSHHRFVNLFINGVCWGSYELMEDQAEDFSAAYLGGEKDDHDCIDQGKLKSGTWNVWSSMKLLLGWTNVTDATNQANSTTPPSNYVNTFTDTQYETLRSYLDMPWFQDYMIWQTFGGHRDWATDAGDAGKYMKNVYFIRPKGGTFKAMPWDMENILWHENEDRVTGMTTFAGSPSLYPPAVIHPRAKTNAEYRLEFADRAWRHLVRSGGALTPAANIARLDKWAGIYGVDSVVLESARWGDYRYKVHAYTSGTTSQVYSWNGTWFDNSSAAQFNGVWAAGINRFNTGRASTAALGTYTSAMSNAWYDEIRRLRTLYFPLRTNIVLNQYRSNGLYPFLNAPELRDNTTNELLGDAQLDAGTQVKLVMPTPPVGTSSAGDIFYTLDGTDPRPQYDQTGNPRAGSVAYTAPFVITQPAVIKARARASAASFPSKEPVRAASTANLTVTYTATGGESARGQITAAPLALDGLTLAAGDRILLKNQGAAAQNGIWTVTTPGTGVTGVWDRAADWDADGEVTGGTWVRVTAGLQSAGSIWRVTNTTAIVVGGAGGSPVSFGTQQFSVWSALMEITLKTGPPQPTVVISEINYNPRGNQGGSASEFVEFYNYGTLPVDMTSWSMDGINFIFPAGTILQRGQRLVIANNENPVVFAAQYPGVIVLGYFGGNLDNGGERLSLLDAGGRVVSTVEYDDEGVWPDAADNGGYSLELISPVGDLQSFANWRASSTLKGSPGADNSTPPMSVIISEFFAAGGAGYIQPDFTPQPDFVELHNPTGTAINVTDWTLNDVPLGLTILNPAQRTVILFSAGPLDRAQGVITLRNATGQVVDGVRYGPQITNRSFYRTGSTWTLGAPTPGADSTPAFSLNADRLVLNELMANPEPGEDDWLELYCNDTDDPCVLTGLTFEVNGVLFTVRAPSVIQGDDWLRLWCDPNGERGDNLNLSLPAAGSSIIIRDAAWNVATSLTYGAQTEGVTQGLVDSLPGLQTLSFPTPGSDNLLLPAVRTGFNEVLVINRNGDNTPRATREAWVEIHNPNATATDLSGWSIRSVMAHMQSQNYTFPNGSSIPAGGYLALWSRDLGMEFDTFEYDHHGLEMVHPYYGTYDRITWGRQLPDKSIGRLPDGSWALLATPTRGAANAGAQALSPATVVKINEWQGESASGPDRGEFFELYNPGVNPVNLSGLWLSDESSEAGRRKTQIPAHSYIGAGGHFVLHPEGEINGDYPDGAPRWPFSYTFRIASGGEMLRLSNDDATTSAIDSVTFGAAPVLPQSQGRLPDGSATIATLMASPGWPNAAGPAPYFTRQPEDVVIALGQPVSLPASVELAVTFRWERDGSFITAAAAPRPFSLAYDNVVYGKSAAALEDDGLYTCHATNAQGTTVSSSARIIVLHNYARWSAYYGIGPMSSDHDNDGLTNGSEFFAGTNPLTATPASTGVIGRGESIAGTNYLTLEFTVSRRASFTSLTGQRSSSLTLWQEATDTQSEVLSTQPNGDQRLRMRFPLLPGDDREFVRLRLEP
jgi:hypothetical protein